MSPTKAKSYNRITLYLHLLGLVVLSITVCYFLATSNSLMLLSYYSARFRHISDEEAGRRNILIF